MTKLKVFFWIGILTIIFFTRFYKLTTVPPSLTIDEVAIGYNAYSILKTGKDEWGSFTPVSFRSVGDYKSPTLIYLTVPFVYLFGLNELSTRLPVAIFSTISIFLFWYVVSRFVFSKIHTELSYLSTLVYALSPWLIPFSRSGFEATVALTFILANAIFIFQYNRTGRLAYFTGMFLFAYLSAITYHSTKVVVPLLNIFFLITEYSFFLTSVKRWYLQNKVYFFGTLILLACVTIFFVSNYIFGPGNSRAGMTFLSKDFDFTGGLLPRLSVHPFSALTSFLALVSFGFKRYLEYFSLNFYLGSSLGLATPGHPAQGVIYATEYLFLVIGFFGLIFRPSSFTSLFPDKFVLKVITAWFFISLLPASLTNNSQHPLRTMNLVPVVSILITAGIILVFSLLKKKYLKIVFVALVTFGYIWGGIRFVDYYAIHYPQELSEARSYGWKQMAIYAKEHHGEYDYVYVDPRFGTQGPYTFGVPYLYFLFYSQYDPSVYMNNPQRKLGGTNFENYLFTPLNWPEVDHTQNNLYIASPWSIPTELIGSKQQKLYVPFLNDSSGLYAISDK